MKRRSLRVSRLGFLVALSTMLLGIACKGPTGPEGPAGVDGVDGLDGAANLSVAALTLQATDFTDSNFLESAVYSAPNLTADIVSNGIVLAYSDLGSSGAYWIALPVTVPIQSNIVVFSFGYGEGFLELDISREAGSPVASVFEGDTIKVVTIAGVAKRDLNVDLSDYEAVMRYLDRFK